MKIEPLIAVKNTVLSSNFYQEVLDLGSAHGGEEHEMLVADVKLILQLHRRDVHERPGMWKPNVQIGNGAVFWFRTDDFESAVSRIRGANTEIVSEPHVNPNAQQHEICFRDPDGYLVLVSDGTGDAK